VSARANDAQIVNAMPVADIAKLLLANPFISHLVFCFSRGRAAETLSVQRERRRNRAIVQ
jgi:hypothetical protein